MKEQERKRGAKPGTGGWAGWMLARLGAAERHEPRLQLLERIALAPRQSLALVEADGRRLLVATSADGGPAFYPLDGRAAGAAERLARLNLNGSARVSW